MKQAMTRRDGAGRYSVQHRCDACGQPIHGAQTSDDEVCGSGDGPGFLLCERKRCEGKRPESVEGRREMYTRQRAKNDERA